MLLRCVKICVADPASTAQHTIAHVQRDADFGSTEMLVMNSTFASKEPPNDQVCDLG
jgi:hypothetical protein